MSDILERVLPSQGSSISLDFKNVTDHSISSIHQIEALMDEIVSQQEVTVQGKESHQEGDEINVMYMLNVGHLTFHSQPSTKECQIDFFSSELDTRDEKLSALKNIEIFFCDKFGWKNVTQIFVTPHGQTGKLAFEDTTVKGEFLQHFQFIDRLDTGKNDIRVYQTQSETQGSKQGRGKMLIINHIARLGESIQEPHFDEICRQTTSDGLQKNLNVLIIDGFDLIIAEKLLSNYPTSVQKITVVEEDKGIMDIVQKHFQHAQKIKDHEKLNSIVSPSNTYIQECIAQGKRFDSIILNGRNLYLDQNQFLENEESVKQLRSLLVSGGRLTFLLKMNDNIAPIISRLVPLGFKNSAIIANSISTQYFEEFQIATVQSK